MFDTIWTLHKCIIADGLGHSSQTSDPSDLGGEYEDETCAMGIDDLQTRKCFNVSPDEQCMENVHTRSLTSSSGAKEQGAGMV